MLVLCHLNVYVFVCSNYPALKKVGMKLGETAASQGILGYMSIDVLYFIN